MDESELYGTNEAAEYLGITVPTVKHHVHIVGDLVPDKKIGQALIFTRTTLDTFNANKRRPGRPKGSKKPTT